MHVLGHSFSQRRKCNNSTTARRKPRDLHIRKVSFSGSSLSSGCSLDSTSTTTYSNYTARASGLESPCSPPHAPPRLFERALISPEKSKMTEPLSYPDSAVTFYDDGDDEDEGDFDDDDELEAQVGEVEELVVSDRGSYKRKTPRMDLPPHTSTPDHDDTAEHSVDYFKLQFTQRPPMPRSHWSMSTIQTIDSIGELTPGSTASFDTESLGGYDDDDDDDNDTASTTHTHNEDVHDHSERSEDKDDYENEVISHYQHQIHVQDSGFDFDLDPPDMDFSSGPSTDTTPQILVASAAMAAKVPTPKAVTLSMPPTRRPSLMAPMPKRPPIKTMDSIENYIKKGGWKRKGIIFHQSEVTADDE